jgi:hypothetical protein
MVLIDTSVIIAVTYGNTMIHAEVKLHLIHALLVVRESGSNIVVLTLPHQEQFIRERRHQRLSK